jgi:hypothetical protein
MKSRAAFLTVLLIAALAGCGSDEEQAAATGEGESAIVIETPKPGANIKSPVEISGVASVFEGTVQIRIIGEGGEEIASVSTTADEGAPGRGRFSKRVSFEIQEVQEAVIEAYEENAASESEGPAQELFTVSVPVRLQP